MKILISGSHGLVGSALVQSLLKDDHEVVRLVRHNPQAGSEIEWHPNEGRLNPQDVEGLDAVIDLRERLGDQLLRFGGERLTELRVCLN